jgi:adenylate cyclase
MFKRFLILTSLLLSLWISLVAIYWVIPESFISIDNRLRDFLFILRGPIATSGNVVIVDIDEKSLAKYGQWPWPRDITASVLDRLNQMGAGIVGLDIVFAQADRSAATPTRGDTPPLCPHPNDSALSQVVGSGPIIGGYYFSFDTNLTQTPSIPAVFIEKGVSQSSYVPEAKGAKLNIDCIQQSFYSSGFFNIMPDEEGAIRHVPLLIRFDGMLYPSLSLEMVRIYLQSDKVTVQNIPIGVESITVGNVTIPTDNQARLGLNFRGPGRTFEYISIADLMEGRVNRTAIEGKFVLVGTSAIGLSDLKPTPFDPLMPGVEVHANAIDSLLVGDPIYIHEHGVLINIMMILVVILLVALVLYFVNGWLVLPLFGGLIYGLYWFYGYLLFDQKMIVNIVFPMLGVVLTTLLVLLLRYIFIDRLKRQLQAAFSRKVSPAVMNDIMTNETQELLKPRTKEITIFFSDIRSFTTISEQIGDPAKLITLLNRYMNPMVESVIAHHGTIDKFIGDAIMAYWNAPIDLEGHADMALRSAIDQLGRLEKLNGKLLSEFGVALKIGVGINTGEATIGEMGSAGRSDYTVIGDSVNLASRLEGLCKTYGAKLIISEFTKNALKGEYLFRELDLVGVKGKSQAVRIYEVSLRGKEETKEEFALYHQALKRYQSGDFVGARGDFERLHEHYGEGLYELYLQRCEALSGQNIVDFDGIYRFTTK